MLKRTSEREPLAIVGVGCRLPGSSNSPGEYWTFLKSGRSGVIEIPSDRWTTENFYSANPGAVYKARTKWAGIMDGIRDFDAEFFGISPAEAEVMDPQQRLLLMTTWEAFEDAGISIECLKGSNTSVYVGIQGSDYATIQRMRRAGDMLHTGTGGALSIAANRLSHKFDFHGPSVSVDTACSSSLVATDAACETLWRGISDIAVAAGVNTCLDPSIFVNFSKANMMSPTGRCRTFDADADGYVRGEGVGSVVLKRLSDALADGDRIYAVIRATCVNQDGYTSTITIPNAEAQRDMLVEACARAGLNEHDIDYVEAHGTGTPVGDPIEAHAIGTAFGINRNRRRRVVLGAGKTATGHLESAAGVTGLIKTALALYNREIPKNLNFKKPNPNIPFDDLGLDLPLEHRTWEADTDRPRRAAVNSFGFGGTNACAILEEAPAQSREMRQTEHPYRRLWMMPLGAQTEKALGQLAEDLGSELEAAPDELSAEAIAANMALRRSHLSVRAMALAPSPAEAAKALKSARKHLDQGKSDPRLIIGRRILAPRIVMAFAGQGGTWWGMAHGLMQSDPVFRQTVEEIDRHFVKLAGWSIADELTRSEKDFRGSSLYQVPCLFALQAGLAARWRAWGIEPSMVIGHSSGEMAAAYVAGINSLPDILKVVWQRGRLQAQQEGRGGIATVGLSRSEMLGRLSEWGLSHVEIAAVNGPAMVNIAGDQAEVAEAVKRIQDVYGADFFVRQLRLDFAPHTFHMDSIRQEFLTNVGLLNPKSGHVPMVSTVTGSPLLGQMADASYWWRNIRDTVQFDSALRETQELGGNIYLEIGPHANLSAMISAGMAESGVSGLVLTSLKRGAPHDETLQHGIAGLFAAGVEPNWKAFFGPSVPRIELPGYPWEKKQYWVDSEELRWTLNGPAQHTLLGIRSYGPVPSWTKELTLEEHDYIKDHVIDGSVLFPGVGYIEMMLAAAAEVAGDGPIELENVEIFEAMMLAPDRSETVQTIYEPARGRITIHSRPRGSNIDWVMRARCRFRILPQLESPKSNPRKAPKGKPIARSHLYRMTDKRGFSYGPKFQGVKRLWTGDRNATAEVVSPVSKLEEFRFHPGFFDSTLHVAFGLDGGGLLSDVKDDGSERVERLYLPVRFERVLLYRKPPKALWVDGHSVAFDETQSIVDLVADDAEGNRVFEIEGFASRALSVKKVSAKASKTAPRLVIEDWVEVEPKLAKKKLAGRGQTWLVFREKSDTALASLAAESLAEAGARVISVLPGKVSTKVDDFTWTVDPADPQGCDALLQALNKGAKGVDAILFGWGVAAADKVTDISNETLAASEGRATVAALHLIQAMIRTEASKSLLWFLTRGVMPVGENEISQADLPRAMAGAALFGMVRTIRTERPDSLASAIDLDPSARLAKEQAASLALVLCGKTEESEIALRGSRWYAPRLRNTDEPSLPAKLAPVETKDIKRHYQLSMTQSGDLDNLMLIETAGIEPGEGEIKIAVKAGGLNFRDVMAATGLLPADAESGQAWRSLGLECAGVVTAIGKGVKGFKLGDRVMGSAKGCFRSEVNIRAEAAFLLPKRLGFAEATTIPSAFGTAYFALKRLARLQPGETVLVQLGTGGVGLAAIQIAQYLKANVISTAGSKDKREYLNEIGVKHVFDSRSLNFAQDVRRATKGRGVDVVLNALAGEAIPLGVNILAPGGRFVEIGKRDIYDDSALGLRPLRKNLSFFVLDMARMDQDDPDALAEVYGEILDLFAKGLLKPLPTMTFKASKSIDAFKIMAQARHIGKVVIDFDEPDLKIGLSSDMPLKLSREGAYMISGGLGGFGAEVARWLARHGARHLYLLGRSGAKSSDAQALLADLKKMSVKAHGLSCDVTKRADVDAVIARIAKDRVPLVGVIHSAMVLDDGYLDQLNGARIMSVLAPKAVGAWNLHEATKNLPLEQFVMFSSFAAVIGSPGQANYVAANRFLDTLAMQRRVLGLPAVSINWGALGGAGVVARNKALAKYLKAMGMPPQDMGDTLKGLGLFLRKDVSNIGFARIDWQLVANANADIKRTPRYSEVAVENKGQGSGGGRVRNDLINAKSEDRPNILKGFIAQQIGRVLKVDATGIDQARPLTELGLDSLTAFQLKNKIEAEIGTSLPVTKFLGKPSINILASAIADVFEASLIEKKQGGGAAAAGSAARALSPRQNDLWQAVMTDGAYPRHALMEHLRGLQVSIEIDPDRLNAALKSVVEMHDALRSIFPATDNGPSVDVLPASSFRVEIVDTSEQSAAKFADTLNDYARTGLDLQKGPLFRVRLYRRPNGVSVIVLHSHAIVTDLIGFNKATAQILQSYFGQAPKRVSAESKTATYFDFANGHKAWLNSEDAKKASAYWRQKLKDLPKRPAIGLPSAAAVSPNAQGFEVTQYVRAGDGPQPREVARNLGVTLHVLVMAAYHCALYGASGATDIVLTTNAANRLKPEYEDLVGYFANTLPVRCVIDPARSFAQHANCAARDFIEPMDFSALPLAGILKAASQSNPAEPGPHFLGLTPLSVDNGERTGFERVGFEPAGQVHRFGDLEVAFVPLQIEGAGHYVNDATLMYDELDGDMRFVLHARKGVFDQTSAAAFLARVIRIFQAALAGPNLTVANLARIG